jgi:hypothetical protein
MSVETCDGTVRQSADGGGGGRGGGGLFPTMTYSLQCNVALQFWLQKGVETICWGKERERWRVCCRRRRKSALCQGDTHFQRRPHLCTHWPVSQPGVVVCTRIFSRGAAMSGSLDGGREVGETRRWVRFCCVMLCCADGSFPSASIVLFLPIDARWLRGPFSSHEVVQGPGLLGTLRLFHPFVFPLVRATREVVGDVSLCRCCLVVWQLNFRGRDLSFSLGVVEEEGESCQGYMLMASMISPGRELHEFLRSRRRDNFDGSVSRGLDAGVNVMVTS